MQLQVFYCYFVVFLVFIFCLDICGDVWRFDVQSKQWLQISTTGPQITGASFVAIDNNLYLFGGKNITNTLNTIWRFSTLLLFWTPLIPMPDNVAHGFAWHASDKFFVSGGITDQGMRRCLFMYTQLLSRNSDLRQYIRVQCFIV